MSKSLIHQQNGHSFVANFLAKDWGSVCESCCSSIHGSLKRFLSCTSCDAVIHWSQDCMQGLTRRCPASQNIEIYPLANEDLKLNIKVVFNFSASLAAQHWRCAECGRGLLPPPHTFPVHESPQLAAVSSTRDSSKEMAKFVQIIDSVQPPLSHYPVKCVEENDYFSEDLGPLVTPADAIVHAAVTKFRQSVKKVSDLPCAKYCNYTGQYYCPRCHWDDTRVIPALFFMLNDRHSRLVCRTSVLWLDYAWTRCIFRVPNPWIKDTFKAQHMLALRLRLNRFKLYIPACTIMAELKISLLKEFAFPDWMLEQPYSLTMHFLDQLLDSDLLKNLSQILFKLDEHLLSDCVDCNSLSKCNACNGENKLFGSAVDATICTKCNLYCHRMCAKSRKSTQPVESNLEAISKLIQNDNSWIDFEISHPLFDAICCICAKNS
ncbi:hypothetical protein Ciccas_000484 [Cichlidogyrus casuarinus]|uniref:Phorbol-ester/DAG-type domain-containing protein n=1 Tax=Cichlidogyrus casuarinus TaxID=1844966 RepID=A0ABD2QNW1_9PLAT